jgi:hypothetical protein
MVKMDWLSHRPLPIPQTAVHLHMQVLVLPTRSMYAKFQAYIADHMYDVAG